MSPGVRYEGEVVKDHSGAPAEGVRVEFHPVGGVRLRESLIVAETDTAGRFLIEGTTDDEGQVVGTLVLFPPEPSPPVRIERVRLETTRAPGNLFYLGRWRLPFPYFPYEVSFFQRGSGQPASGIEVEFRRTGGLLVEPDTFRVTTDFLGNVKLKPFTSSAGEVSGELIVYPLPPFRPFTIPGIRLRTFVAPRNDSTLLRVGIGPHLPYAGVLVWSNSGKAAEGVELEFRRTGGIPIHPSPFRTSTDRFGTFHLNPAPLLTGEVEGDLVVRSPASIAGTRVARLRLSTFETDHLEHLGFFGVPAP